MTDEQVIEAAAKAFDDADMVCIDWHFDGEDEYCVDWDRAPQIEAAIRAADEARAEQGFVLVKRDDLQFVLDEFGWREIRYGSPGIETVHARLNAAIGDGEHITETE